MAGRKSGRTYYVIFNKKEDRWEVRIDSKKGRLISKHRVKGRAKRKAKKLCRRYNRNAKIYNRSNRKVTEHYDRRN